MSKLSELQGNLSGPFPMPYKHIGDSGYLTKIFKKIKLT